MSAARGLLAGLAAGVVIASSLVVPPLAQPVSAGAAPSGVDDDASVPGRGVPVPEAEPSAAEDATQVTSVEAPAVEWPSAAAAVVDVPVPTGRALPGEVPASAPVAGVSVLADGAAPAALRPGDGAPPEPTGPGPVSPGAPPPEQLGGLTAGGLSQVRVAGRSRQLAEALGAAQVFTVDRVDGVTSPAAVDVRVDFSGYAEAFGGSYADRLRLVELPACALTRPSDPACAAVPVPVEAVHHPVAGTLTARVLASGDLSAQRELLLELGEPQAEPVSGSVFAVMSSGQGTSTGDYEATDLDPGGTWQVGLSSGAFTYSYPVPEPPLVAGSGLGLSLSYNSQSVDAFTQSTNNQSGFAGLGWSMNPGFIERKFRPCREDIGDGSPKERSDQEFWGNLCWESPDENDGEGDTNDFSTSELYLHLNGVSTRIVKDRVSGQWRTEQDLGWRLDLITGGAGKDYWQVFTPDGSRYRFGYTDGANWWVPVVGDDPGEPRYANYPTSYQQTWRWNLDRVFDPTENQTILNWVEEVNYYKRFLSGNILTYDRGGYLQGIQYGVNGQVVDSHPTGRVVFNTRYRCVEATVKADPVDDPYPSSGACPSATESNASSYPDVPLDLKCSASSCDQFAPTFWSLRRLDRITTYRWDPQAQDWRNIYRLQLRFKTLNPPGLTGRVLWLDRIFPVGLLGLDTNKLRLPGVNFDVQNRPGRVDHAEAEHGVSEMILPRVFRVYNGYGGRTDVTYGHVAPCPTSGSSTGNDEYWDWYNTKVGNWDVNTDECAPVWYKPEGAPAGWGQFHKYLALKVVEHDRVGGSQDVVTSYEYRGDAAWALGYGFIDSTGNSESWNEWRGYPTVRVHTGSGTDPDGYSMVEHTFFRGLYYDFYDDHTYKQVTLTDFDGNIHSDHPGRAGRPMQVRRYQMTGYDPDPALRTFSEVSSSRYSYRWFNTGDGPGRRNPRMAQRLLQRHRVALDGGGWREESQRITAFDSYGLPTEIVDFNELTALDNTCTSIVYAQRNSGNHYLLNYPETAQVWDEDQCGTGNLLSRTVTLYDGRTEADLGSQSPFDGNPTEVRTYTSATEFVATQAGYDDYGRVTSRTDPEGNTTTISFDPASNWPQNGVTTTNPAGHAATVRLSSAHGQPTRVIDANGGQTDINYDQLGRPVEVYLPADPESAGIASMTFDYSYTWDGTIGQPTAATRVGTHTLASKTGSGEYLTSYVFDDGFGRVRETQTASPAGGQVVEAAYYDPRGMEQAVSAPFHHTAAPGAGLVNPAPATLPSWSRNEYDTLGRVTDSVAMTQSTELWRTSTTYQGDHTTVTPPQGAPPVTVWTNVNGSTTLRQEHLTGGGTVDTSYAHDREGQLIGVTDDAGNQWSYSYDLAGRKTTAADPDAGTTSYTYDAAGRIVATTDGRGETVSTSYDSLGRPASRWHGPVNTGTLAAQWVYDTLAKGQLTSATRWHNGDAYTTTVDGYNQRYQPTGVTVSIPTSEGALSGSYSHSYGYTDAGWAESVTLPAAGGLPAETVTTSYTALGQVDRLTSSYGSGTAYVDGTSYDATGDLIQQVLGDPGGQQVARDLAWDEATGRLDGITTTGDPGGTPTTVQDDAYSYDPAGNLTSITDAVTGQAQCFAYDELRRLVEAWTTASAACTTAPSSAIVDGPDPYWHSWTFDTVGNRLTQTEHPTAAGDQVTTSYTYPTPGTAQPHTLTSKSVTDPAGTVVTGYAYDPAGNTTSRPTETGDQQTLAWTPEGHLASVTDTSGTADYVYGVDGNRLLTHHADGAATLYLSDGVEVLADPTGITTCRRYYGDVAVRTTTDGLTWLAADHHGTGSYAIDADTGQLTTRRLDPYGNPRGTVTGGTWPDDKAFLGAPADPTGLTHLGAREYDPIVGRFISVDPIMDLADPQQIHGYSYANSNPLTWSDPSGLARVCLEICGGEADKYVQHHENRDNPSSPWRSYAPPSSSGRGGNGGGGTTGGTGPAVKETEPKPIVDTTLEHGTHYVLLADGTIIINGWVLPAGAPPSAELARWVDRVLYENDMHHDDVYWAVSWICSDWVVECDSDFFNATWTTDVADRLGASSFAEAMALGAAMSWASGGSGLMASRRGLGKYCSFSGDTHVLMADGTTKPISEIQPGDQVLATNPETGEQSAETVATLWIHNDIVVQLEVESFDGSSVDEAVGVTAMVNTTADHPFWNRTDQQWQSAAILDPGDRLLSIQESEVIVGGLLDHVNRATAYNLTITNIHTYFVLAGDAPVLVHNCPESSGYRDVTKPNSRVLNRSTDVTRAEFEANLLGGGWARNVSRDGKVTIFEKGGARYVVRANAGSTGGPTADFYRPGSTNIDLKIRLGY